MDEGVRQLADFNCDGNSDIVRWTEAFDVYVIKNGGQTHDWLRLDMEAGNGGWKVGDLTGDGCADLVRYAQ
jgi:hypothetical protein